MKRIITFWLPISVVLFFLSMLVYKGIDIIFETKKVPVAISNEDIYRELKVPLIGTICNNGTTLHPNHDKGQLFVYSFNGYMTNLPYRITLSKNVDFEDCAGCIGDWKIGMFSPPEYNGNFISLKEFIIQMVRANENYDEPNLPISTSFWRTDGLIWKITPKKDNQYLVEVTSSSDEKWVIII